MRSGSGMLEHFGRSAQFRFVHDAESLHQPGTQHVGRFVFGEDEEFFQRDAQGDCDHLQGVEAGKVNATLKPRQMPGSNLYPLGQLLLGQVGLLAKLLDASSQLLSCIHPTPCVMGVISHRVGGNNSLPNIPKIAESGCTTFPLAFCADTITVRHSLIDGNGVHNIAALLCIPMWMSTFSLITYGEER